MGGAPREQGGAVREQWASTGEHRGSTREHGGSAEGASREHEAVQGRSRWEPEMGFLHLSLTCLLMLFYYLDFATSYRILQAIDVVV